MLSLFVGHFAFTHRYLFISASIPTISLFHFFVLLRLFVSVSKLSRPPCRPCLRRNSCLHRAWKRMKRCNTEKKYSLILLPTWLHSWWWATLPPPRCCTAVPWSSLWTRPSRPRCWRWRCWWRRRGRRAGRRRRRRRGRGVGTGAGRNICRCFCKTRLVNNCKRELRIQQCSSSN